MIVFYFTGIKIALKYTKFKDKSLLFAGIGWTLIGTIYIGVFLNFIYYLSTDRLLPDLVVWIPSSILLPLSVMFIYFLLAELKINIKRYKLIVRLYAVIISIIIEIYLFYAYIIDVSLIGKTHSPVVGTVEGLFGLYVVYGLISIVITVLIMGIEGMKSDIADVKLKGKFLIVAAILFLITSIISINIFNIENYLALYIYIAISQVTASFMFYNGFLLPNWIKNYFIKSK
ncbi:MAG: hypothetical protein ACFFAO_21660 [Candidatus Hermodarchaeota archaeon]